MRIVVCIFVLAAALLGIMATGSDRPALASSDLQIVHYPPSEDELPLPGAPVSLSMRIAGGDRSERRVRLFVVIDGQLIDLPMLKIETDPHDNINYMTTVHAPISEMSYQWVAYSLDGSAVVSDRYTLGRSCISKPTFTELHLDENLSIPEKIEALVNQLAGMDDDIRTYDEVLKVLETLQKFVKS